MLQPPFQPSSIGRSRPPPRCLDAVLSPPPPPPPLSSLVAGCATTYSGQFLSWPEEWPTRSQTRFPVYVSPVYIGGHAAFALSAYFASFAGHRCHRISRYIYIWMDCRLLFVSWCHCRWAGSILLKESFLYSEERVSFVCSSQRSKDRRCWKYFMFLL